MRLIELKSRYYNGIIEKQRYIKTMHQIHRVLFEYAEFIRGTDIKSIEISDDSVIMTSRSTDAKIICNPTDERIAPIEILNFNYYEKTDFEMVLNLIQNHTTIFDIGANIGWYTINICKHFKNTTVYSFEPIPITYEYLNKNTGLMKYRMSIHLTLDSQILMIKLNFSIIRKGLETLPWRIYQKLRISKKL